MKISKKLLKTIAASVLIGGVMVSCEKEEIAIAPEDTCEIDCKLDHHHIKAPVRGSSHAFDCPACGMG